MTGLRDDSGNRSGRLALVASPAENSHPADGSVPLTAFLPNDRAFQVLAIQLTRKWYSNEADVLGAVAGKLGIDAVEKVLL